MYETKENLSMAMFYKKGQRFPWAIDFPKDDSRMPSLLLYDPIAKQYHYTKCEGNSLFIDITASDGSILQGWYHYAFYNNPYLTLKENGTIKAERNSNTGLVEDGLLSMVVLFNDDVKNKTKKSFNGLEGLKVLEISHAILESSVSTADAAGGRSLWRCVWEVKTYSDSPRPEG